MNLGAILSRFVLLVTILGALVACQQEPELSEVVEFSITPTLESMQEPSTATITRTSPTRPEDTLEPTSTIVPPETPTLLPDDQESTSFSVLNYDKESTPQTDTSKIESTSTPESTDEPPPEEATSDGSMTYRIAFVAEPDGNSDIFSMNADGSHVTRLTDDPAQDEFPLWSPDGQYLAFISNRYGGNELFLLDVDSSDLTRLTEGYNVTFLTWSPDSKSLAFSSMQDGDQDLYVLTLEDGEPRAIANSEYMEAMPNWSPNGNKITYVTVMQQMGTLNSVSSDGSDREKLFETDTIAMYLPQWSPNDEKIVFTGDKDEVGDIYLYDTGSRQVTNLTDSQTADNIDLGAWSQDGQKILVYRFDYEKKDTDIYVLDVASNEAVQLTDSPGLDTVPVFSPDGQSIIFNTEREGYSDEAGMAPFTLYIMDADGSNQQKLFGVMEIKQYVWSPLMPPLPEQIDQKLFILNLEADQLYYSDQFEEAAVLYDEMLPLAQELEDEVMIGMVHVNRGDVRAKIGDFEGAVTDFESAVTLGKEDAVIYNNLCWWYGLLSKPEKGLPYCDQAIDMDPDPGYFDSRGLVQSLLGNYEQAAADFQIFVDDLAANPDPHLREELAEREIWLATLETGQNPIIPEVLQILENTELLERVLLDDAIIDMPFLQALNHFWIARDHHNNSRWVEAINEYTEAIALYPNFSEAFYFRGIAHRMNLEEELAIADYEQAIALNPDHAPAYHLRGLVIGTLGDYEQAIASYAQAIAIDPNNPEYYRITGSDLMALGRNEEALEYLDKTLELNPEDLMALYLRGVVHYELGNDQQAIADLERSFALGLADSMVPQEMVNRAEEILTLLNADQTAEDSVSILDSIPDVIIDQSSLGLPADFVNLPPEDLDLGRGQTAFMNWDVEKSFAFMSETEFEMIFGYLFTIEDDLDRSIIDESIENTVVDMENELGSEVTPLDGLENVGEKASGGSSLNSSGAFPYYFEAVMFRQGDIVGTIYHSYAADSSPTVQINEVASALLSYLDTADKEPD